MIEERTLSATDSEWGKRKTGKMVSHVSKNRNSETYLKDEKWVSLASCVPMRDTVGVAIWNTVGRKIMRLSSASSFFMLFFFTSFVCLINGVAKFWVQRHIYSEIDREHTYTTCARSAKCEAEWTLLLTSCAIRTQQNRVYTNRWATMCRRRILYVYALPSNVA